VKIAAIVQARVGSVRFPDKVLAPISGAPLIELLLRRLTKSEKLHQIIVVTSTDPRNLPLVELVQNLGFPCEQGSEDDVLDRYVHAADKYQCDVVVRITGDCPLIDPDLVDEAIELFTEQ